jgi:hypothetical protein
MMKLYFLKLSNLVALQQGSHLMNLNKEGCMRFMQYELGIYLSICLETEENQESLSKWSVAGLFVRTDY